MTETEIALLLCAWLSGGDVETRHVFDDRGGRRAIRVDCETEDLVIEVGLDQKSSSRDSVHQALFSAALTGKTPVVILVDRDGSEGRYEQEMRVVAAMAGVAYARCSANFILRWRMTAHWRDPYTLPDQTAWGTCDIAQVIKTARVFGRPLPGPPPALPQDPAKADLTRQPATVGMVRN